MGGVDSRLIGDDGFLNEEGVDALCALLEKLNPDFHGDAFIPMRRKVGVVVAVELVIVREGKVLLSYRDDKHFTGWHTPGTYQRQDETWQDTATRCAGRELERPVKILRSLLPQDNPDSPRFHDVSILLLCEMEGLPSLLMRGGSPKPGYCRWFSDCPEDLISVHRKFWPEIAKVLG